MAGRLNPKTLAKTLTTIAVHSPSEYGLFWDPDGSMPWKEFHRALQEDPSLRFVRESHIRELVYLGLDMPFFLDGRFLRLKNGVPPFEAIPVKDPQDRLYHAVRRAQLHVVRERGLNPSGRSHVPLASHRDLAQRIGMRRDPRPVVVEVYARKALARGLTILEAGPCLYLTDPVPPDLLLIPLVREDLTEIATAKRAGKPAQKRPELPLTPGSFLLDVGRLVDGQMQGKPPDKGFEGRMKKGSGWKRASRGERRKRDA